ncbi:MAG TPA: hypothetical protein VMU30_13000 [Bacteroidota bacterium]|nr:hypothetical protein [Bacteroidota bacterium]
MKQILGVVVSLIIFAGCNTLTLAPGDFSWPVESVLKVNSKGIVQDQRYSFSLDVKKLLFAETQDSVDVAKWSLRMIRDTKGYYYITAAKFKNVYVFEQTEAGLKLSKVIFLSAAGIDAPEFNQRPPFIQLLNGNEPPLMLSKDGIQEGGKK